MTPSTNDTSDAGDLYRSSIVFDALNAMKVTGENIDTALSAGISALHVTVVRPRHDLKPALLDIGNCRQFIDANRGKVCLADTANDIREAKKSGKVAIVMGLQDSKPIRDELALLRPLRDMGVRIIQLTHNTQNYIGTGCLEPDHGLTRFGRKVVAEMNRLGLIIDISHCGSQTSLDAIECSEVPVLCTHSNPLAIAQSVRNKSDKVIERLAARGGVIGIASWSPMVYRGKGARPVFSDVLDCFDHVLRLVGPDHVAIGTDMCDGLYGPKNRDEWLLNHGPGGAYPEVTGTLGNWYSLDTWYAEGLASIGDVPAITPGLLQRGHKPETVRKVLGENLLRVFDQS